MVDPVLEDSPRGVGMKKLKKLSTKSAEPVPDLQITRAELRFLVETYLAVQQHRVKAKNRLKGITRAWAVPATIIQEHSDWVDERMLRAEHELQTKIEALLKHMPIWTEWLQNVRGVGPILAGGLIAWIDPMKFDTVSKVWRFAGLAVVDGAAEHYKAGEPAHFVRSLRTHCWKLATSFVKNGDGYRQIYDQERHRLAQYGLFAKGVAANAGHAYQGFNEAKAWNAAVEALLANGDVKLSKAVAKKLDDDERQAALEKLALEAAQAQYECRVLWEKPCSKQGPHIGFVVDPGTGHRRRIELGFCPDAHKDAKAKRKTAKVFLAHYWEVWRTQLGAPIRPLYVTEHLGHGATIQVIAR